MNNLFVYLLPSIIGIKIYNVLTKNNNIKDLIINYLSSVLISNLIIMIILAIKNKFQYNLTEFIETNMSFSIKYILISIIINIILGYIYSIMNKNVSFKLERINQDEKGKKE